MHMCRLNNLHVISTWGVAEEEVQKCVECWCSDTRHMLQGMHGGGGCCDDALCPSVEPQTAVRTYFLQYNVTYRCGDMQSTPVLVWQIVWQERDFHYVTASSVHQLVESCMCMW